MTNPTPEELESDEVEVVVPSDTSTDEDEGSSKNVKMKEHEFFTSTMYKQRPDGGMVMSDFADIKLGDSYKGMPASMEFLNVPELDENGEPVEDTGGALDDPKSMTQFHTKQRFPVGTKTAVKVTHSGGDWWYVWEYIKQRQFDWGKMRLVDGYQFSKNGIYNNIPFHNYAKPPRSVEDLAAKGGYWFNNRKYS